MKQKLLRCRNKDHPRRYIAKYDAFYCPTCDMWTERECYDKCSMCDNRPKRPSLCMSEERKEVTASKPKSDSYFMLIRVYGGTEPKLLFSNRIIPNWKALQKAVIDHLTSEPYDDEDGIFYLKVRRGQPVAIESISGGEMEKLRKAAGEDL